MPAKKKRWHLFDSMGNRLGPTVFAHTKSEARAIYKICLSYKRRIPAGFIVKNVN